MNETIKQCVAIATSEADEIMNGFPDPAEGEAYGAAAFNSAYAREMRKAIATVERRVERYHAHYCEAWSALEALNNARAKAQSTFDIWSAMARDANIELHELKEAL